MADRYVSLPEVHEMMSSSAEHRELSGDQKISLEHAEKLSKISAERAVELREKLSSLEYISDLMACKITDIMPTHPEDVRALFAKERLILEKEYIDEIIDTVNEYL